jgi:NADH dehydrogenase FAD-containing subunit
MAPTTLRKVVIDASIAILWILLEAIDFLLVGIDKVFALLKETRSTTSIGSKKKPRVLIVGASFAGLTVQRQLSHLNDQVDVTVVDLKMYFEYLPGVLRCFVEPSHLPNISCPLSVLKHTTVVTGEVKEVSAVAEADSQKTGVMNQVKLSDGRILPFDYLVLATGSTYTNPIKPTTSTTLLTERQTQWNQAAADLAAAQTVVIIGAGAVGVELAGEILTEYPNQKRVIMVDMATTILPGFRQESIAYTTQWLAKHGAELHLGAALKELSKKYVVFADGRKLDVDLIYMCTGGKPNSSFLKGGSLPSSSLNQRGAVLVNDHLQVDGFPHVFCAGDLCFHAKSNELKLGHTAQVNAHLVAENLARLITLPLEKRSLLHYPSGVVGNAKTPKIYNLSLGKYDATLAMNSMVLSGGLAAVIKWLLEWTQTAAAAQRPVGIVFWFIADEISNFLGRTILPTVTTANTTAMLGKKKTG